MTRPTIHREYGYLNGSIWYALTTSNQSVASKNCVLICPPIGHEYTHTYRTLFDLSDQLALKGSDSLRIDYRGTGNSIEDMTNIESVDEWVKDIEIACSYLHDLGYKQLSLVGLRMGGTLISLTTFPTVKSKTLWHPITDGRRTVRDLELMGETHTQGLSSGGFLYGHKLMDSIKTVKLNDVTSNNVRTLILDREDSPSAHKLATLWQCDYRQVSDYLAIMTPPQYSSPCPFVLEEIARWASTASAYSTDQLSHSNQRISVDSSSTLPIFGCQEEAEDICDAPEIFGVLTQPKEPTHKLLLIPNTGAAHNVGPNRLHVDIARFLANEGIAVFRFDLANLGEGGTTDPMLRNAPYPPAAHHDLRHILTHFRARYTNIGVVGICSGANLSYRCLTSDPEFSVDKLVMINTIVFDIEHDPDIGNTLIRPPSISTRACNYFRRKSQKFLGYLIRPLVTKGWWPHNQFYRSLNELDRRNSLTLMYSADDVSEGVISEKSGAYGHLLKQKFDYRTIDGADHTFTSPDSRIALAKELSRVI